VRQRTEEVATTQQVTIHAMATLAETRDNETGNHIRRTQFYVKALAEQLRRQGDYPELTDENIDLLYRSAPLHDIGKVGIPDRILLKPGRLDADEFAIMKTQAESGGAAIAAAEKASAIPTLLFCATRARSQSATTKSGTAPATRAASRERRLRSPAA
jgi:putative two-component system response regulator